MSKFYNFKVRTIICTVLLIIAVIMTGVVARYLIIESNYNTQRIESSTKLQILLQQTAHLATLISNGDSKAQPILKEVLNNVNKHLNILKYRTHAQAFIIKEPLPLLEQVVDSWGKIEEITKQLAVTQTLENLHQNRLIINNAAQSGHKLIKQIRTRTISNEYTLILQILERSLKNIKYQMSTLEKSIIAKDKAILVLKSANQTTKDTLTLLLQSEKQFATDTVHKQIIEVTKMVNTVSAENIKLNTILDLSKNSITITSALINSVTEHQLKLELLTNKYKSTQKNINIKIIIIIFILPLLGVIGLIIKLKKEHTLNNKVNKALFSLIAELTANSETSMLIQKPTTKNLILDASDSFSYIVELKRKILDIKKSTTLIRNGSTKIKNELTSVINDMQSQALKIKDTSFSVNTIINYVKTIALATEQSSEVYNKQQDATENSRNAVSSMISAMDNMREQIQDTAKRIKRLGESAQEIDEIIEIISDTTEQTNVLAMNASIQAAAAGEAGKGFRSVASEVQRLAEKSDKSLKHIVTLIRSIQSDTKNAILAMENSIQQVVTGTQTTNDAGKALRHSEDVSATLNQLITTITGITQQQIQETKNINEQIADVIFTSNNNENKITKIKDETLLICNLVEKLSINKNISHVVK